MPQNFPSGFEGLNNNNNNVNESVGNIFEREQPHISIDDHDFLNGRHELSHHRDSRNAFRKGGRGKNSPGSHSKKQELQNSDGSGAKSIPQPRQ